MPEELRTLIVILVLATVVFAFAKAPACALASTTADFEGRRNLWFAITIATFLAHNFWIYIVLVAMLLFFLVPREKNKLALYFFILFAVPPISNEIAGVGGIRLLFGIDYIRLLALMVLLPTFLSLRKQKDTERIGRAIPDKFLVAYLIYQFILFSDGTSSTNLMRRGVFYPFIDVLLPYYVASRSIKTLEGFRDVLMSFVVAALVLSAVGFFEFTRHWLLYSPLEQALGIRWNMGNYMTRDDSLRAVASTGESISLGYAIAVAIGLLLYLKKLVPNARSLALGIGLLIAGLISPLSRGPWLGAAVMLLLFILISPRSGRRLVQLALIGVVATPLILVTPVGNKIISYLPWIGTVESSTVTYREALIRSSLDVIFRNPFFGIYNYFNAPEMQVLKHGSRGFIDMVNSYLGIALSQGLVGLSLFLGVFITVIFGIFKAMKRLTDNGDERYVLGQALLSVLIGILVIIGTVSSISIIPIVYWSVAGLGVAYARLLALGTDADKKTAEAVNLVKPRRQLRPATA